MILDFSENGVFEYIHACFELLFSFTLLRVNPRGPIKVATTFTDSLPFTVATQWPASLLAVRQGLHYFQLSLCPSSSMQIEQEIFNEAPLCAESSQWPFNTTRQLGTEADHSCHGNLFQHYFHKGRVNWI